MSEDVYELPLKYSFYDEEFNDYVYLGMIDISFDDISNIIELGSTYEFALTTIWYNRE